MSDTFSVLNTIKAIFVCIVVNAIYSFFTASTSFVEQAAREGKDVGRIEAFISASKVTVDLWPHIMRGWGYGVIISFICCAALLLLLSSPTPNKSLNEKGVKDASSG